MRILLWICWLTFPPSACKFIWHISRGEASIKTIFCSKMPVVGVASLFQEGVMRERKIGVKVWHCWGDGQVCVTLLWQCVSLRAGVWNCWSWLPEAVACWSREHVIPLVWNYKEEYRKKADFVSSATNITWISIPVIRAVLCGSSKARKWGWEGGGGRKDSLEIVVTSLGSK